MIRLAPRLIASLLFFVAAPAFAQQGPFKIVILAGEDSVNVIQQKTAVAPLVEVRDRNNNPVSGVAVTFAVQGGKAAAFQGGAATMRTDGFDSLIAAATPEAMPPPPTGTNTVPTSGHCSRISRPIVPWPMMICL